MLVTKIKTLPSLYKNAIFLYGGLVGTFALGFVFWSVAARLYTAEIIGYSSALIQAATLLAQVSLLGLPSYIIRFLPEHKKPEAMIDTFMAVITILSVVLAVVFIANINVFAPGLTEAVNSVLYIKMTFILLVGVSAVWAICDEVLIAKRVAKYNLYKDLLYAGLKILLMVLFAQTIMRLGIIAALTTSVLAILILTVTKFFKKAGLNTNKGGFDIKLLKGVFNYSAGSYIANTLIGLPTLIMPLLVINVLGAEANAYFFIAWQIGFSVWSLSRMVAYSLFAEGSYTPDKLKELVKKAITFTLVPTTIIVIFLWLVGYDLLKIAFGTVYAEEGNILLKFLVMSSIPYAVTMIYSAYLRVTKHTIELAIIWIMLVGSAVGVSYISIMDTLDIASIGASWFVVNVALCIYSMIRLGLSAKKN